MKRTCLIFLLSLLLSACGFHLRGSQVASTTEISRLYLISVQAANIANEVTEQLENTGTVVMDSAEGSEYTLKLEKELTDRSVLSVSANTGKVEEYQLTLNVLMSVTNANGDDLLTDQLIRVTRDYTFDEDAVLGKFSEEELLIKELKEQAAAQIIRRLNAITKKK